MMTFKTKDDRFNALHKAFERIESITVPCAFDSDGTLDVNSIPSAVQILIDSGMYYVEDVEDNSIIVYVDYDPEDDILEYFEILSSIVAHIDYKHDNETERSIEFAMTLIELANLAIAKGVNRSR